MSAPYAVLPSPPPSASPKEMSFTIPTITTFDPSHFQSTSTSPAVLSNDPFSKQVGSRYETVPHAGPGTATYCRQPTRAQLVRTLLPPREEELMRLWEIRRRTTVSSQMPNDHSGTVIPRDKRS
jgi:hypothetical protein